MATVNAGYLIPAYLADREIDHKAVGFSDLGALDYVACAEFITAASSRVLAGSIINLPNGVKYNVNQTYTAPTFISTINIRTRLFSRLGPGAVLGLNFVHGHTADWIDAIGTEEILIAKIPGSPSFYQINGMIMGVTVNAVDNHAGAVADVTIVFEPLENEWTYRASLYG